MATLAEALSQIENSAPAPAEPKPQPTLGGAANKVLVPWIKTQSINVTRHAAALRPFRKDEFGTTSASPTAGHIESANELISGLRRGLLNYSKRASVAAQKAAENPTTANLGIVVDRKEKAHRWVQGIEKIWDFYFELFGQRQSRYANWLLSCDRIALDCYRTAYLGIGVARTIPAPPPFSYMRTGFSPATFRRGIRLSKLGKQLNPFPLVELPYHRLVNPWTLGAVLHEISHNLQTDLGLSKDIPRHLALRLLRAGMDKSVARIWTRWNREMFADMSALLLGGPEVVGSLMDVIGRGRRTVLYFNPAGVHPTPYLRMLNSVELLRRMGFKKEAEQYRGAWKRIYPSASAGSIPEGFLRVFPKACEIAVDSMCYKPYPSLGNKTLAQVMPFGAKEQQMIEEAAKRLASGTDPGIMPDRFVLGAVRFALNHRLARPGVLTTNFYKALASG